MAKIMLEMLLFMSSTLNQKSNAAIRGWHPGIKERISGSGSFSQEVEINIIGRENMRFESGRVAVE